MTAPLEKSEDLRIRRTRLLLQQAFKQLIMEKQFQSITVQEIADRAMVHRATFYDHFLDKYDLLEYVIREEFKQSLHQKLPQEFTCTVDNLDLLIVTTSQFLCVLGSQCLTIDKQVISMVQTQITGQIDEVVRRWMAQAEYVTDAPSQLTSTVTTWAIYGAAVYWSQNNATLSLDDFLSHARPRILATLGMFTQRLTS